MGELKIKLKSSFIFTKKQFMFYKQSKIEASMRNPYYVFKDQLWNTKLKNVKKKIHSQSPIKLY